MAGTSSSPITLSRPSPGRATPGELRVTGMSGSGPRGTCCDLSPPWRHLAAPRGGESMLKSAWPSSTASSSCWAAAAAAAADSAHSSSRGGSPWSAHHCALLLVTAFDLDRAREPGSSACCSSSCSPPGGGLDLLRPALLSLLAPRGRSGASSVDTLCLLKPVLQWVTAFSGTTPCAQRKIFAVHDPLFSKCHSYDSYL